MGGLQLRTNVRRVMPAVAFEILPLLGDGPPFGRASRVDFGAELLHRHEGSDWSLADHRKTPRGACRPMAQQATRLAVMGEQHESLRETVSGSSVGATRAPRSPCNHEKRRSEKRRVKCRGAELNRRPRGYESLALTD